MTTKTYCDCCNKEIKFSEAYHLKISPHAQTEGWARHEVCDECANKIKEMFE